MAAGLRNDPTVMPSSWVGSIMHIGKSGILVALIAGLGLTGCVAPAPYDRDQVTLAVAGRSADADLCVAKANANDFPNMRGYTDCILAADVKFAAAIKLKQQGYLVALTQRVNLIGDQADAGTITREQAKDQLKKVLLEFDHQLVAAYRENSAERIEAAAKMQAFGQAMSNASASLAASTPPPPAAPITCTSAVFGGRANGNNTGAMVSTMCN